MIVETGFADGDAVLAADGLVAGYTPGIDILRDLSCRVWPHRISCVVGPNGTGKSTLLKALFGFLKPRNGKVMLKGADITGTEPHPGGRLRIVPPEVDERHVGVLF